MDDLEVKKIDTNNFEVTETITRSVEKKTLKAEIEEIEQIISSKRKTSGIESLENQLSLKKELLAQLK